MTIRDDKPSFGQDDTMIQLGEDPGEDNRSCQTITLIRRVVRPMPMPVPLPAAMRGDTFSGRTKEPYPLFDIEISVGNGEHRDDSVATFHGLYKTSLKRLGQHLIALADEPLPPDAPVKA